MFPSKLKNNKLKRDLKPLADYLIKAFNDSFPTLIPLYNYSKFILTKVSKANNYNSRDFGKDGGMDSLVFFNTHDSTLYTFDSKKITRLTFYEKEAMEIIRLLGVMEIEGLTYKFSMVEETRKPGFYHHSRTISRKEFEITAEIV